MELQKDKLYRVNGEKLYFQELTTINNEEVLIFTNWGVKLIIQEVLIESLDEIVDVIDTQAQAMQKDAFLEFVTYGTINGKKPRKRYIHNNIK